MKALYLLGHGIFRSRVRIDEGMSIVTRYAPKSTIFYGLVRNHDERPLCRHFAKNVSLLRSDEIESTHIGFSEKKQTDLRDGIAIGRVSANLAKGSIIRSQSCSRIANPTCQIEAVPVAMPLTTKHQVRGDGDKRLASNNLLK